MYEFTLKEDEEVEIEQQVLHLNPESLRPVYQLFSLFNVVNDPNILKGDLKGLLALLLETFNDLKLENARITNIMER